MPFPSEKDQFKPGESGNLAGKPKGTKNLSTIIREFEKEDYDWSLIPIKDKDTAKKFGAPWKAIVATALAKAYSGDIKAAEWLRKGGYGDKLEVDNKHSGEVTFINEIPRPKDENKNT